MLVNWGAWYVTGFVFTNLIIIPRHDKHILDEFEPLQQIGLRIIWFIPLWMLKARKFKKHSIKGASLISFMILFLFMAAQLGIEHIIRAHAHYHAELKAACSCVKLGWVNCECVTKNPMCFVAHVNNPDGNTEILIHKVLCRIREMPIIGSEPTLEGHADLKLFGETKQIVELLVKRNHLSI